MATKSLIYETVHELRSVSKAFASPPTLAQYRTNSLFNYSKYGHVIDDFRKSFAHTVITEGYELLDGKTVEFPIHVLSLGSTSEKQQIADC